MPERRKLAAILVTDIVGFSRMTGADEERTLALLRALRGEVTEPAVGAHNGRVVKSTGDGALIEFRSAVDAVRCAVDIQSAMQERNEGLAPDDRIEFRMGIHVGDVVEEADGDLMGDGVNIAARLESLAEPGAVCLSDDAYRQVRSRVELAVTDLGEQTLKNISEPLKVFAIRVAPEGEPQAHPKDPDGARRRPDKPSIAVLPFTNMSGDADQEYFADGMAEDIITALSRFEQLFVVARNSSFVYKGRAADIKQVGRELGVRYVLEGSVRKAGERVRITGQLIDAETGTHLWADRFDGQLEDVFDLQDQITANVVGAIEPTVRKAEIERARRKPAENMGAYDLFLQALPHVYAVRPQDNLEALKLLERAIALDPDYAPALAHSGWCLVQRTTRAWGPYSDDDIGLAVSLARRALATGSDDAQAVVLGGFVLTMLRQDYAAGMDAARRGVAMNPGSGFVVSMAGCALIFGDDAAAGVELLERAMALCPNDPSLFSMQAVAAVGHLLTGAPEVAVELVQRSMALNPDWDSSHWTLAATLMELGRTEEASAVVGRLLEIDPQASASRYDRILPIRNEQQRRRILDNLIKAGLPE